MQVVLELTHQVVLTLDLIGATSAATAVGLDLDDAIGTVTAAMTATTTLQWAMLR